ncbi:N-acetylneuraminate synthase family protein [Geomonas propionica]|uniref:N-acetylneuraminate synthase family protein n=1 Tax=Geomonas propionica TaxID=2798582 RepID=A0ABS0YVC9_9BACT|nr:N-acetylneuraminate synthase family protein [Geomonas propionica]MBJ6801707.1 N-acetylneuraminate synthase family protein [Geomonas propionica]
MMRKIEITPGRFIGDGEPCFVIAEIGSNHNHDFELAKKTIDAAAEAGVDAVKFQTFRASSHYSKHTPGFSYLNDCKTFDLIQSLELDRSWHQPLKEYAESRDLIFLSSPCDREAIDELHELGAPAFKVASFDMSDLGLIRYMAKTARPVILSTGMADWMEIQRAVQACHDEGNDKVILLQCTSLYPAPAKLSNLRSMGVMRDAFGVLTGYSDHTEGDHVCLASVALGACVIEKHFTLDRTLPGPDHPFAIEPGPLKALMQRLRDVESAMGDGSKAGPRPEEREMYEKGRRSIHAKCTIRKGELITADKVAIKRPGFGVAPHLIDLVIGREARVEIPEDHWISWDMI